MTPRKIAIIQVKFIAASLRVYAWEEECSEYGCDGVLILFYGSKIYLFAVWLWKIEIVEKQFKFLEALIEIIEKQFKILEALSVQYHSP